jgi:hypothetical protein
MAREYGEMPGICLMHKDGAKIVPSLHDQFSRPRPDTEQQKYIPEREAQ